MSSIGCLIRQLGDQSCTVVSAGDFEELFFVTATESNFRKGWKRRFEF